MTYQLPTKAFGVSLILAGVTNLTATLLNGTNKIAAGANVGIIAFSLTIPALLAIVITLYRHAPTLATVGGFMAAFGAIAGALWMALPLMGASAETQLALPLYAGGLMYPLAGIVLAVGLQRRALAPTWVNIALITGFALFVVTWFAPSFVVGAASASVLLLAYGWLGVQMWGDALTQTAQTAIAA